MNKKEIILYSIGVLIILCLSLAFSMILAHILGAL